MRPLFLMLANTLVALLTPFETMFEASEQAAQAGRRRELFRLPYEDPSRESRAKVIYEADLHLRTGGVTKFLRSWVERHAKQKGPSTGNNPAQPGTSRGAPT